MGILKNRLLKNGFWSIFGTFLNRAVNLISIPIFTRLMNTSEYGSANIFMTYVSIFMVVVGLDFFGCVSKGQLEFKDAGMSFMSVGVFSTGIFTVFIILIFNLFSEVFVRLLDLNLFELNVLILYSYAMAVINFMSMYYIFHFMYQCNMGLNLSVALLNVGCSVFFMLTLYTENRVRGRVLGAAVPTILIAAGVFVSIMKQGNTFYNRVYLKYYVMHGIPLIPHNLSHFILGNADKIMIKNMIGSSANGVYSLVYNIGLMLSVLIEALNNVWNPWMFRKMDANDAGTLRKAYSLYVQIFSVIAVAVGAVTPEIIKIISPREYWDGIRVGVWIVFSTYLIFIYQLYVNLEFYEMKTYLISLGTILAAFMNIGLNLLFLKAFGYGFAAVSTIISYCLLAVFHMFITNFILKCHVINNVHVWGSVLITFIMVMILNIFLEHISIRILIVLANLIFCGIYIWRDYRKGGIMSELLCGIGVKEK